MNEREQKIFLKGIEVGMKAIDTIEQFLPQKETSKVGAVAPKTRMRKGKRMPWTEEEKQILKDNPQMSVRELSELIPTHKINSIGAMRSFMGLKREKVEVVEDGLAKLGQDKS